MTERNLFTQYKIRRLALQFRSFTMTELKSATGMTTQTIYSFIHDLKQEGDDFLTTEDLASDEPRPGRPPVRYHLSPRGVEFLASQNVAVAREFNEAAFEEDPPLRPSSRKSRKSQALRAAVRVVKKGLHIKGEITGAEDLQIDGSVVGLIQLEQSKVTVLGTAEVVADIIAREVVIYGRVKGNVRAKDLVEIKKDASLHGDITTARVRIDDGAYFKGSIEIDKASTDQSRKSSASKATELADAAGLRNKVAGSH